MTTPLIIGGGPSGAATAIRIAQAQGHVRLVERHASAVDKVCGEFLSEEACRYLTALGLNLPALGAVPLHHVRLCHGHCVAAGRLPFAAMGLSRRVLDEALLQHAARCGVTLHRGSRVTDLRQTGDNWRVSTEDFAPLESDTVFLATGKQDLKAYPRPRGIQDDLIAFKQHWQLSREQQEILNGHVDLILFRGGYAGLQPIENGLANLCLVVRRRRFREVGQHWHALLTSIRQESVLLNQRLTAAQALSERPLALSAIPYGHVQRGSKGLWRLGDQAAVIASFTGDGLSIALHSAELAAQHFLAGTSADAYQRHLARDIQHAIRLATPLSLGMMQPSMQGMLSTACRLWPPLMSWVAKQTRVPSSAMPQPVSAGATG